jgi:hypothetical protein
MHHQNRYMKTLYLHIGHYKTGSSAIQKYCSDHARMLAAHGYHYPKKVRGGSHGTNHGALSLTLAARYGFGTPPWYKGSRDINAVYSKVLTEIHAAPQPNILISSEEFYQLALRKDPKAAITELRDRFAEFDTRIVLYIREPMALLKSWYNEVNKGPHGTHSFPVFFKQLNPEFLSQTEVYRRFADVFGPDRMILRSYRHTGMDHIRSFLDAIGFVGTPDEAEIATQQAQDLASLELNRLAKRSKAGDPKAALSRVGALQELAARVDRINAAFSPLPALSDAPLQSQLSLVNIYRHLHTLLEPLVAQGQADNEEATVLRNGAQSVEKSDPELALVMMRTAHMIRPKGQAILRKLREYEARQPQVG